MLGNLVGQNEKAQGREERKYSGEFGQDSDVDRHMQYLYVCMGQILV